MKNKLIVFLVFSISICSLYSQNKTIKGRLIAEDFHILAGVSIMINDTIKVGNTDVNGFFKVEIPICEKKLSFDFVGLEPTTIELTNNCDNIEVVIMYIFTYDFISLRRAERKRKKRYKKLPEIHKQAFEKGIFETEQACYNREFEPFYLEQ